jgi:hypothetical protein
LLLLSLPEMYRNARVFSAGIDAAVTYAGRPDLDVVFCVPVQVLDARRGQVRFQPTGDGSYAGTTTWDVPFDFPVVPGSEAAIGSACTYSREGRDWPPGLGLHARVRPAAFSRPTRRVVFDGHDLRPLGSSRPAQLE